uniref:Uncharacterized protein n=1 Tax=Anguilla anguilla TaxID=7936 RepID=A0A0E9TXF4_ANGAN
MLAQFSNRKQKNVISKLCFSSEMVPFPWRARGHFPFTTLSEFGELTFPLPLWITVQLSR